MRNLKFLPAIFGSIFVIAIIFFVAFHFIFLEHVVNYWWFQSLNLESYFWLRLLYKYLLSGGVTLTFFAIFFFHFWIASRYLGLNPPHETIKNSAKRIRFQSFADVFMGGTVKVYTPISLALAIFVAIPFYNQWEASLLFFFGSDSGVTESIYGRDISFYLLSYPIYILIQKELLTTAALVFSLVGILYWLEHIFIPHQKKEYHLGAKIHLTILISFVVGFVVWGFMLQRFSLLYTDSHEPIFYGPGFVEIRYKLPLLWFAIVAFIATAVTAILFIFSEKHRIKTPFFISLITFLIALGLPEIQFIPDLIQKFIVNPNPVRSDGPYIQQNIDGTMDAYDLKRIHTIDLSIKQDATEDIDNWGTQKHFENIPVWDREYIIDSYKQLQEIRPYYKFLSVDEDRYFVLGHIRQVNFAAREINISKLPPEAQNWENTHLRYTHGYGAVITPAAQDAGNPLIWYLRDLNLYSDVGFSVKTPDIYYGEGQYDYAIVPNNLSVIGLEHTDLSIEKNYTGKGGIPMPSLFKKALLAFYLKDEKIFFSTSITNQSKLKIRRNITERVNTLTPFLHHDKAPYLVITKDRFYWILDAYTLSNHYPVSKPAADDFLEGHQNFNYIRNSVKVVVDAYDGNVDYYISDPSDPIIRAYSSAYPGLFKDLNQMPLELRKHLRYPRDLYSMQMKVYAKYHQSNPALFYEQAETWEQAKVHGQPVLPYYQTMDFGNCNDIEEFVMIHPMTPFNRDNLSIIGIAGIMDKASCGLDYKPNITVYKFGKDTQVNGPAQVEALIQQDPIISEQFTLWNQTGSQVKMGRMIILPIGHSILYVQPVYMMSSQAPKIPQLARVIVSIGNVVVMDKTLLSAFNRLKQIHIKNANDNSSAITPETVLKSAAN